MAETAAAPGGDSTQNVAEAIPQMTDEQKAAAWAEFERIIYQNLDKILEKRPAFPVTKFAKAILEDVSLDENGDPILKKKKKKDKSKRKGKSKRASAQEVGEEEKEEESPEKKKKKSKKEAQ